jgi:FecR-like protein
MSDDYLWDGSGTPDPDVERLEQMLGRLRTTAPVPTVALAGSTGRTQSTQSKQFSADSADSAFKTCGVTRHPVRWRTLRFLAPALAAAAAIVLMVGVVWRGPGARSWEVASIDGRPRIGSRPLSGEGRLAVGQTLSTDASSRARVEVSTIGEVTVDTNTRVRLVETRDAHHQLALERGTLHAFIVAPPGQFVVDTPSATATDLGCIYDLSVDEDGSGLLTVFSGWVAFEDKGRESFVPAGASSRTDRLNGPGTPRYDDAEQAFRDALDEIDYGRDAARKVDALREVLERARPRDAMTLWHLIPRLASANRGAVVDTLAAHVAMPPAVTRDAVMRLDRGALDQWWDALGLLDVGWWRKWKGPYPAAQ